MADNETKAEVAGLQTSNNSFSATPPGSMLIAENVMIVQKGVGQPRNGQARAFLMPSSAQVPLALTEFQGSCIANYAIDKVDDSYGLGIAGNPTVGFSGGPYNPVDFDGVSTSYGRMKFGFGDRFLYFCSTTGPKALEDLAAQPRSAGLLRMGDIQPFMQSVAVLSPGFLPYGSAVAYRSVLRRPTVTGVSQLSPPSGRAVIQNRLIAPPGAMVRSGGNTVTVTFPNGGFEVGLNVGDTFDLDPGEADFPAGTYTVTFSVLNVIKYVDAGANVPNTIAQDFDTGPRSTALIVGLSSDATVETPVRIYRSLSTSVGNDDPSDELFLVGEVFPDAGNISAGFLVFNDTTPESVLQLTADPLYTNPQTGEGALQANYSPPLYRDIAWWGGRMWYLNTTGRQSFDLQLLGVGSPDGVQNNDTLTIEIPSGGTYTFTFKNSPGAPPEVKIVSDGQASFNIQQTAQLFINAFNQIMVANAEPVRAYYNGDQGTGLGKILLERIDFAPSAFSEGFGITASRPESWVPALDSADAVFSTAERRPNGLDYSKLAEPEAVPPLNRTAAGSSNFPAARILALQNALLIFKQGDGIWALTGSFPFQVNQISTANLIAIDAAAVFADSAWAYTDQGILRISDAGGSVVVSRPIETELNFYRDAFPAATQDWAFAVPYETERRIMFFVPVGISTTETTPGAELLPELQAYCYNNATDTWTKFTYEAFSGVVSLAQKKLLLGIYDYAWSTSRVTLERKGNGHLDTADADFTKTISASTTDSAGNRVVRLSNPSDVDEGDGIVQGSFRTKIKAERFTDLGHGWFELWENAPLTAAACTVYKHFDVKPLFQPVGHPSSRKSLTRLSWLFKPESFEAFAAKTLVMTDQIQAELEIATPFEGFGLNPFGTGPFGNPSPLVVDVNPLEAKWTNAAQFFVGLKLSEVWVKLRLQGFTATIVPQDAPVGRGK